MPIADIEFEIILPTFEGIQVIKDILTRNWDASNITDNRTPGIDFITNFKRYDYRDSIAIDGSTVVGDKILIYKSSGTASPRGYTGIDYTDRITIDVRSVFSTSSITWQAYGQILENEVLRIVEGKRTRPASDDMWDYLIPTQPLNLDDKNRRQTKRVVDVFLMRLKEAIPI